MAKTTNGKGRESEMRELPVKLTQAELLQRGDEMADCEVEIEGFKVERLAVNDKIKIATARRAELAHMIDSGEEKRKVRCEWVEDFQKNVWRLVRQDTGDSVDTRPMTAGDRQGSLLSQDDADPELAPPPRRNAATAAAPAPKPRPRVKPVADDAPTPIATARKRAPKRQAAAVEPPIVA